MMPRMPHEPMRIPTVPSRTFRVPPQLEGLRRIAYNLWWTWHPQAKDLFRRVDSTAWQRYRTPIAVLSGSPPWDDLLASPDFMAEYRQVLGAFDAYMENGADSWFRREHPRTGERPIAYFCAEYGFDESLGIYSGGLGILAGDHTKSASDMALPLIGVGLLYRRGYFRQTIDADGHQEHAYPNFDLSRLPVQPVIGPDGDPLRVLLELPGRDLTVGVWCLQVGRVPVLLLDTDLPENHQFDRPITHILYVRGREMRLHQEIVLGIGGVRAIRALGIEPAVWHLNEGHSAFLLCERTRELVATGRPVDEAFDEVRDSSVFTIHTPVSAGNERFDSGLVRRVVGPLLERDPGALPIDRVLELGRGIDADSGEFDMTAFSLRLSRAANAVSQLHARTANQTWEGVTPRPILGITNGVHVPSWVGDRMRDLDQRYLGADLDALDRRNRGTPFWERVDRLPARELWEAHQRQKLELTLFAQGRLRNQFARLGESPEVLEQLEHVLDPSIFTIGFARRFATYKRAGLLFSDVDRLARLVTDERRPVQIIFAGKAHPADRPGQGVIQEIFSLSRSPKLRGRVFILEDYDVRIARFLVQGVDIWLNTPRRPLEASGTSGMKAAMNGIANMSVLDGWWDEGWQNDNGWAIGGREPTSDEAAQDWADAQDIYRLLEEEIVPRYYRRDEDGMPVEWVETMRRAIGTSIWQFSTTRMLHEYAEQMYLPALGIERAESPALRRPRSAPRAEVAPAT
jgi:starch phosphorylase